MVSWKIWEIKAVEESIVINVTEEKTENEKLSTHMNSDIDTNVSETDKEGKNNGHSTKS